MAEMETAITPRIRRWLFTKSFSPSTQPWLKKIITCVKLTLASKIEITMRFEIIGSDDFDDDDDDDDDDVDDDDGGGGSGGGGSGGDDDDDDDDDDDA